jgi:hypothetical protein
MKGYSKGSAEDTLRHRVQDRILFSCDQETISYLSSQNEEQRRRDGDKFKDTHETRENEQIGRN